MSPALTAASFKIFFLCSYLGYLSACMCLILRGISITSWRNVTDTVDGEFQCHHRERAPVGRPTPPFDFQDVVSSSAAIKHWSQSNSVQKKKVPSLMQHSVETLKIVNYRWPWVSGLLTGSLLTHEYSSSQLIKKSTFSWWQFVDKLIHFPVFVLYLRHSS